MTQRHDLDEISQMELAGAERRLECAHRNLRDFQRIHGTLDDAGFVFRPGVDENLLRSLERELMQLRVEVDEAARAVAHARRQLAEIHRQQSER